jgi:GT2 family glycosyltransferase
MRAGSKPTVAAVVPATDAPPTLERCIAAIRTGSDPPDELIVVTEPPNAGPAAARNAGARQTTADILLFVDADVLLHPDAVERVRAVFAHDPGLAGVFGSYDDTPAAPGVVSVFRNLLHHHVHQEGAGRAETFWAGIGALRRDVFLEAGGFDEARYRTASIEDIELGMRLVASGATLRLDPSIQATHLKRWTLLGALNADFSRRGVPWVALLVESRCVPSHLNLGWRHRAGTLLSLAALAAGMRRRRGAMLAALLGLVALNRSLYALAIRRLGVPKGLVCVGVHALHHVAGAASVPAGVAVAMRHRYTGQRSSLRSPVPVDEASAGVPQGNGLSPAIGGRGRDATNPPLGPGVQPIGSG